MTAILYSDPVLAVVEVQGIVWVYGVPQNAHIDERLCTVKNLEERDYGLPPFALTVVRNHEAARAFVQRIWKAGRFIPKQECFEYALAQWPDGVDITYDELGLACFIAFPSRDCMYEVKFATKPTAARWEHATHPLVCWASIHLQNRLSHLLTQYPVWRCAEDQRQCALARTLKLNQSL